MQVKLRLQSAVTTDTGLRRTNNEDRAWTDPEHGIYAVIDGVGGMKEMLGQEIGPSSSRSVTQADIDAFAEVSGDHQWIHVDPERAKAESPYGMTIAHGNLALSLADSFRAELAQTIGPRPAGGRRRRLG